MKIRINKDFWYDKEVLDLNKNLDCKNLSKIIIVDYKTAKTAAAASYKDQLVLYAYLIGMTQGWSYQQIRDNVDLFIFFPFSTQKKEKFCTMTASTLESTI